MGPKEMISEFGENRQYGPAIAPVSSDKKRPFWSVMIPTYNCAKYLARTLHGVLAQAPSPDIMEIEVVDDCSSDFPEKVVDCLGAGRIKFHRNDQNLGATGNFNQCLRRSSGRFVHILHGDDTVETGFYQALESAISHYPRLGLYCTRCNIVDESDQLEGVTPRLPWLEQPSRETAWISYSNPFNFPAMVVRREFCELTGGFNTSLVHVADWEMWHRAISLAGGLIVNKPLASYRSFGGNDTSKLAKSGENIRDYLRFAEIIQKRIGGFDMLAFRRRCVSILEAQAARFGQMGDSNSSDTNLQLAKILAATTN